MAGDFDPYRTWLGIPPDQQPANHYRLLGIALFEDQSTAIEHAADQRMAHLRTLQAGKHSALSQKLLNEVANARVCLLNAEKKVAYDRQLRERLEQDTPEAEPARSGSARSAASRSRTKTSTYIGYALGAITLLVLIAWGVFFGTRSGEEVAKNDGTDRVGAAAVESPSTQRLVLHWPPRERAGGTVTLDGRDVSALVKQAASDRIKLPLKPGRHSVTIERLGYEPFEQQVTLHNGTDATVRPVWKKLSSPTEPPDLPELPMTAEPEPEPPEPEPQPRPPEPKEVTPKPEPKETPPAPKPAEIDPALKLQQELDAKYARALDPVEAMVSAWDFSAAVAALAKVEFDESELTARRNARGRELQRLVKFKTRIIAKINTADPPLKKSDLMLRGINGDVAKADEESVSAKLASGKTESHAWRELGEKTRSQLVKLAIDGESADDLLSAGLLAFASGDIALAEKLLAQAQSRGADIGPYLASLAERAFGRANELLEKKEFSKAAAALADIEKEYAKTPWFASHRKMFDAARAKASAGIYEVEAEKLYTQAAELFKENELFDLKPLVEKFRADYADSRILTDVDRKPSFAEMEQAVSNLGKLLTVRQTGKADFKSIQAAIDAAPPNSLIEIQDVGPYNEEVKIPREKQGLTIRGKKGCWPIITAAGEQDAVTVEAADISIEQVVIAGKLQVNCGPVHVRSSILSGTTFHGGSSVHMDTCVYLWHTDVKAKLRVSNSVWLLGHIEGNSFYLDNVVARSCTGGPRQLRHCTVLGLVHSWAGAEQGAVLLDSIIKQATAHHSYERIDHCNVFGSYGKNVKPGKNCISVDPQFVNPKGHDYRLGPKSPCRGKASDGGDLGVRYTPEMLEMLKLAFALRQQGVIKF